MKYHKKRAAISRELAWKRDIQRPLEKLVNISAGSVHRLLPSRSENSLVFPFVWQRIIVMLRTRPKRKKLELWECNLCAFYILKKEPNFRITCEDDFQISPLGKKKGLIFSRYFISSALNQSTHFLFHLQRTWFTSPWIAPTFVVRTLAFGLSL